MKPFALLALAAALASCSQIRVCRRELWVRNDERRDQLDLLILSEGVGAEDKDDSHALDLARRTLDGRKIVDLPEWPEFDLDELATDPDEDLSAEDRLLLQEIVSGIQLQWVQAYVDEKGRLSWAQHFRVRGAQKTLDALNRYLRLVARESDEGEDLLEIAQARRYREASESDWEFVRFEGAQLRIRLPLIDSKAWELSQEIRKVSGPEFPVTIDFEDAATVLYFGDAEEELWHAMWPREEEAYDCELLHRMLGEKRVDVELTRKDLIERFRVACQPEVAPLPGTRRPIERKRH